MARKPKEKQRIDFSEYGEGFVYFVQMGNDGPIKIGRANDPSARISSLATACPVKIVPILLIPGADLEKKLHAYFYRCWIKGEWFEPLGFLEAHIESLKQCVLGWRSIQRVNVPIVKPPELGEVEMGTLAKMKYAKRIRDKVDAPDKRSEPRYRPKPRAFA